MSAPFLVSFSLLEDILSGLAGQRHHPLVNNDAQNLIAGNLWLPLAVQFFYALV